MHARGSVEFDRAQYTIETLHLDDRDHLPAARRDAYEQYASLLHRYVFKTMAQAAQESRARTVAVLRRTYHPTVWAEMKRQRSLLPELRALFQAAPEALEW